VTELVSSNPGRVSVIANLCLIGSMVCWGTQLPGLALLLDHWDPFFLSVIRYGIGLPAFVLCIWPRPGESWWPAGVSVVRLAALGGAIAGFATFYTLGIALSDPVMAAILSACFPIVAALVTWIMTGVLPSRPLVLAMILATLGGGIAGLDFSGGVPRPDFRGGEPLLLLGAACWIWYSMMAQHWLAGCSQRRLTGYSMLATLPWVIATWLVLFGIGRAGGPPAEITGRDWMLILWTMYSGGLAGTFLWNLSVRGLGIAVPALFMNLIPFITVLTLLAIGIDPRTEQVLGGLLVVGAVAQAQFRQPWRRRRA
jgi:drug/metabolite transporter (DMT)-like permease